MATVGPTTASTANSTKSAIALGRRRGCETVFERTLDSTAGGGDDSAASRGARMTGFTPRASRRLSMIAAMRGLRLHLELAPNALGMGLCVEQGACAIPSSQQHLYIGPREPAVHQGELRQASPECRCLLRPGIRGRSPRGAFDGARAVMLERGTACSPPNARTRARRRGRSRRERDRRTVRAGLPAPLGDSRAENRRRRRADDVALRGKGASASRRQHSQWRLAPEPVEHWARLCRARSGSL